LETVVAETTDFFQHFQTFYPGSTLYSNRNQNQALNQSKENVTVKCLKNIFL